VLPGLVEIEKMTLCLAESCCKCTAQQDRLSGEYCNRHLNSNEHNCLEKRMQPGEGTLQGIQPRSRDARKFVHICMGEGGGRLLEGTALQERVWVGCGWVGRGGGAYRCWKVI